MNNEIDVIEKITQACKLLNDVDEYLETLPNQQSLSDLCRSDLLHTIENEPEDNWNLINMTNVISEIRRVSKDRRKVKIDMALSKVYQDNIGKLNNIKNREMLLEKLNKAYKSNNGDYTYCVYTKDEIDRLLCISTAPEQLDNINDLE